MAPTHNNGNSYFCLTVNEEGDTDEPWGVTPAMAAAATGLQLSFAVSATNEMYEAVLDPDFATLSWSDGDVWSRVHE